MRETRPDNFDWSQLLTMLDDDSAVIGSDNTNSDIKAYLSTGSLALDWELAERRWRGGYPSGRMIEISGPENVGKTTLATHALVSAQQGRGVLIDWKEATAPNGTKMFLPTPSPRKMKPGLAILIDSEHKFAIDRAQRMGMNLDQLVRIHSEDGVMTFEKCIIEIEKVLTKISKIPYFQTAEVPVAVVLDSLAQAPIEAEMDGDGLQDGIAAKARKIRMAMRRMTSRISNMNVFMLFTNHIYARIGAPGNEVSGGRGLKLAASLRLDIKKKFKDGELNASATEQIGIISEVRTLKSSYCTPPDSVSVPIKWRDGISQDYELLSFFLEGEPCVPALAPAKNRVEATMPDGTKHIFWPNKIYDFLDAHPGFREHLLSIFERTMLGEKPLKKKEKAKDEEAAG